MKLSLILIMSFLSFCLFKDVHAFADHDCENVRLVIQNLYSRAAKNQSIMVTSIKYLDRTSHKWRTEKIKRLIIKYTQKKSVSLTLRHMEGHTLADFQVEFKIKEKQSWSTKRWSNPSRTLGKCSVAKVYEISVRGSED